MIPLLAAITVGVALAHLWAAATSMLQGRRFWTGYFATFAAFYLALLWSYLALVLTGRTPAEHMALIGFIGGPLLAHVGVVAVALVRAHRLLTAVAHVIEELRRDA